MVEAREPRLRLTHQRIGDRVVTHMWSAEEARVQAAMRARTPHDQLVPLMQAARAADDRYRQWAALPWDDPVV